MCMCALACCSFWTITACARCTASLLPEMRTCSSEPNVCGERIRLLQRLLISSYYNKVH
jgi:hypothetical protein